MFESYKRLAGSVVKHDNSYVIYRSDIDASVISSLFFYNLNQNYPIFIDFAILDADPGLGFSMSNFTDKRIFSAVIIEPGESLALIDKPITLAPGKCLAIYVKIDNVQATTSDLAALFTIFGSKSANSVISSVFSANATDSFKYLVPTGKNAIVNSLFLHNTSQNNGTATVSITDGQYSPIMAEDRLLKDYLVKAGETVLIKSGYTLSSNNGIALSGTNGINLGIFGVEL